MHHHWLRGFKEIAGENYLDMERTKEFLDERTLQHTQFSRLTSSSFLRSHERLVREKLEGEGTGHDWWHIKRVRDNALFMIKTFSVSIS